MKYNKVILSVCLSINSLYAGVGLDYLNSLRTKTGLPLFSEQANLRAAAQSHSAYMQTNNLTGHYEDSTKLGFTGANAYNRAVEAGYLSTIVAENIAYGTETIQESIDNLFSAIYHRFAFLSLEKNEVGMGISNNNYFYTFNMGNSGLNTLCQNATYTSGSYYTLCADNTKKIEVQDVDAAVTSITSVSPDLILWPAKNSNDIPPVFYEERPDPLPNHSVSGYPISVEFNNKNDFNTSLLTVSSFTLENTSGTQVDVITSMNNQNDPNDRLSEYQFALFPEKRLEWGTKYTAEFIYSYNGQNKTKNWCFATRSLSNVVDRYYRLNNGTNYVNIISGKTYALYLPPSSSTGQIQAFQYSYTGSKPVFTFLDSNTLMVTKTGASGEVISFSADNRYIKLTLSSSDTAIFPSTASCDYDGDGILDEDDLDDDNDGYTDIDENAAGSNPLNANSQPLDTDGDKISNVTDLDDDNDGLLDTVELAYGLDPLNAADAETDLDSDGFSNSIEISVGTDIRNGTIYPIWVLVSLGDIFIILPSLPSK